MLFYYTVELISISWFYGTGRFAEHGYEMGMRIPSFMMFYWKACWAVITPILLFIVTILAWVDHADDGYMDYVYPPGIQFLGWTLELYPIVIVVIVSIYIVIKKHREGNDVSFLKPGPMMQPKTSWGARPHGPPPSA